MVGELPGLVGLSIVCQPCHPTSSLQCGTLQHSDRGRELQNPLLALEVQFPKPADKKELNLSLIVTIHIYFFFPFLPPAWHSCGRWNTATPQSKVLDWECRAARWKSQAAQVRPLGGLGTAVWPVLQALLGSEEQERVWARWCERDMVWATGLTSSSGGWQLPHLGDRAHWASHLMGTPGWSWRLFPRLS